MNTLKIKSLDETRYLELDKAPIDLWGKKGIILKSGNLENQVAVPLDLKNIDRLIDYLQKAKYILANGKKERKI